MTTEEIEQLKADVEYEMKRNALLQLELMKYYNRRGKNASP